MTELNQEFETTVTDGQVSVNSTCPTCGLILERGVAKCPRDGTAVFEIPAAGSKIADKYEFISTVGSGGMGVIYKARNPALDKFVAIKMMHMHLMSKEAVMRFQQEGHAASQFAHSNIVAVHDLGVTDDGQPFLVMDFVEGVTLAEELKEKARLPLPRAVGIFLQVCDAIAHAHKLGVLHRDLKPSNIMLVNAGEDDESVRILDFGIAKMLDADDGTRQALTRTGEALGSPLYMSPEQALGKKVDQRSDLYSMGCVIYECLTGTPPFVGSTMMDTMLKHLNDVPLPLAEASLGVQFPNSIESVVAKLLKKDPEERYQSMNDLKRDLMKIEKGEGKALHRPALSTRKDKEQKQPKAMPIAIGVLSAAFVWMGIYAYQPNANSKKPCPSTLKQEKDDLEELRERDAASLGMASKVVGLSQRNAELMRQIEDENSNSIVLGDMVLSDEIIAQIAARKSKQVLDFSGSSITDQQLQRLAHLPLLTLKLTNTEITDRALGALKNTKTLTHVDLRNCLKITPDGVRAFRGAHPRCRVELTSANEVVKLLGRADELARTNVAAAESEYDKALQAEKVMFVQDSVAIPLFEAAGVCKRRLNKFAETEALCKKALELWQRVPGTEAKQAVDMSMIAEARLAGNRPRAAIDMYNQAIAMAEKAGEDRLRVDLMWGLSSSYNMLNQKQESEQVLHRAYELAKVAYGANSTRVGTTLFNLATTKLDMGKYDEAYKLFARDLPIYERNRDELGIYGIGMVKRRMGEAKLKLEQYAQAQTLLEQVLKLWKSGKDVDPHEWLMTHLYYANSLTGQGKYTEAEPFFNAALALAQKNKEPAAFQEQIRERIRQGRDPNAQTK